MHKQKDCLKTKAIKILLDKEVRCLSSLSYEIYPRQLMQESKGHLRSHQRTIDYELVTSGLFWKQMPQGHALQDNSFRCLKKEVGYNGETVWRQSDMALTEIKASDRQGWSVSRPMTKQAAIKKMVFSHRGQDSARQGQSGMGKVSIRNRRQTEAGNKSKNHVGTLPRQLLSNCKGCHKEMALNILKHSHTSPKGMNPNTPYTFLVQETLFADRTDTAPAGTVSQSQVYQEMYRYRQLLQVQNLTEVIQGLYSDKHIDIVFQNQRQL